MTSTTHSTDGEEPMTRKCIVCGKSVIATDVGEHLKANHLGPHYFWFCMRKYRTMEPSMLVGDILKMCGGSTTGQFIEERNDKWVYYSQGQNVDLTREPHFSVLLPATY